MTASANGPIRGAYSGTVEDHLMRIVVATMNHAVDVLCRAATARSLDSSAVSEHICKLGQAIAGMTLDALCTWPDSGK